MFAMYVDHKPYTGFTVSTVEQETSTNGINNDANKIARPIQNSVQVLDRGTWLHDSGWMRKIPEFITALPKTNNYKNSKGPGEVQPNTEKTSFRWDRDETVKEAEKKDQKDKGTKSPKPAVGIKLGWIQGVMIPCLLNIWGVMLFLRISWVVSHSGIGLTLVTIGISYIVCFITTLSMSAICTNGEIKGGGIYYIISRSLGPEFGASVGLVFAFANAVAASLNTIGFCDSLNFLLSSYGLKIVDGELLDVWIVGTFMLALMCLICAIGMDWESKAQNFLIVIIVTAMADFILGTLLGPMNNVEKIASGFVGLSSQTIRTNFYPDYRVFEGVSQNFSTMFAVFFPSVTGIQAGANISGDLRNPATAIPKGTLLALLISMLSYVAMVLLSGAAALRDVSGNVADVIIGSQDYTALTACDLDQTCQYGLHNDYYMMQKMAVWSPLIYGGCWAATLSTALTNLLSVPRLIQALGVDHIYPGLMFFSKGYGKHGEPYRGYVLTFLVSFMFLLIGNVNLLAPIITTSYLASYALINFCTFHVSLIHPLGWRPTFKYYNIWLSLVGFIMCVGFMVIIDWKTSLVTFVIFITLYLVVHYRNPDVNWGSSAQAQIYKTALSSAHNLARTEEHVKNYWPQLLVLAGLPQSRPALVDLGNLITEDSSLLIVGDITQNKLNYKERYARARACDEYMRGHKVRAFYANVHGWGFEWGARALVQSAGVGRLTPNVLLMGYKADWTTVPASDLVAYFNVLHMAFENHLALAIVRVPGGLDNGIKCAEELNLASTSSMVGDLHKRSQNDNIMHADSDLDIMPQSQLSRHNMFTDMLMRIMSKAFSTSEGKINVTEEKDSNLLEFHNPILPSGIELSERLSQKTMIFRRKMEYGTLDVWWLYDDGGLTILLPYIISQRSLWRNCKLRVITLATRDQEMEQAKKNMANLLYKFRIDYSSVAVVKDITTAPQPETTNLFEEVVTEFTKESASQDCCITDTEMAALREKTNRQLRLRELLLANSKDARLVVMSLPMPRKDSVSAPLYMAWLEMLSRDLPPMLFIRGNNTTVLTIYS